MKKAIKGIIAVVLALCVMGSTAALAAEPAETEPEAAETFAAAAEPADTVAEEAPTEEAPEKAVSPGEPEELPAESAPAPDEVQAAPEEEGPSFLVYLRKYEPAQGIMQVRVAAAAGQPVSLAVWANSSPEKICEYTEADRVRKDLEFTIPITDFALHEGTYTFEARLDGKAAGSVQGSMYYRHGTLKAEASDRDENEIRLTLTGAKVPGSPRIWFLITNTATGSRTLSAATPGEDGLTSRLSAQRLPAAGQYNVRAFAALPGSTPTLAETSFRISGLSSESLVFSDIDGSNNGTFTVQLTAEAPTGAKRAVITIWTQPDAEDAKEFELPVDGTDISCTAASSIYAFSGSFGTYYASARVELTNGRWVQVPEVSAEIAPRNYILITGQGASRRITLVGPDPADAASFQFLVRPAGTQNEGPVLQAQTADDGNLYAVLSSSQVPSAGTYDVYAHSNGSFYGPVQISFASGDFMSEAERRIAAGCQRVYNKVGTDLYDNYMWVVNNFSYVRRYGHLVPPPGYTRAQLYAVEGLEKQRGNCYTFASTFAELAKGLGYDARYVEAEVYGSTKGWQPHGIVLVYRNGGTYICDPELQFASSRGRNLYMQPVSSPKAKYRW